MARLVALALAHNSLEALGLLGEAPLGQVGQQSPPQPSAQEEGHLASTLLSAAPQLWMWTAHESSILQQLVLSPLRPSQAALAGWPALAAAKAALAGHWHPAPQS